MGRGGQGDTHGPLGAGGRGGGAPSLWRQGKRPWPFGAGERGGGAPLALWRLGTGGTPGPLALGKGVQPYLQPFKFLKEENMQPFNF